MLTCLAETDIRPAFLRQTEIDFSWGNVDQTVAVIQREVIVCFSFEVSQHLVVAAFHPARRRDVDCFELAFNVVFVAKPMRHNVKLKWTDSAKDQVVVPEWLEQLCCTLFAQLREPFLQCLDTQWILENRAPKYFRRKVWNSRETNFFALRKAVTDVDRAVIVQADNVSCVCRFGMLPVSRQKRDGFGNLHFLAKPDMVNSNPLTILAGADAHEGNAVTMPRIHVRLNFENESSQLLFHRIDITLFTFVRQGRRRMFDKL